MLEERFTLVESLGYGGTAEVFLAEDRKTGEQVALKKIHSHLTRQPRIRQRLKQEVAITRKLHSPGIIRVHELYENNEELALCMEYLSGGDLKSRILYDEGLPYEEVLRIMTPVLKALETAHQAGYLHRDLKPHNILFDAEGEPRIADFGLAHNAAAAESAGTAGTPEYCAPEIIQGTVPDSRSDLYSTGIILYEALTGKLPFSGNSPWEILEKQLSLKPQAPSKIRPQLPKFIDAILEKALQKDPGLRFQTAGELLDALTLRDVPELPSSIHRCSQCGQPISEELGICLFCNPHPLILNPAARAGDGYRVIITGPGAPGERLKDPLRYEIVSLMKQVGISSKSLEQKGLRVPFTLSAGLTRDSANHLAAELNKQGIETLVIGKDVPEVGKEYRRLLGKRVKALGPRYLLVLLGTSYMWSNILNRGGASTFLAILWLAVLGIAPFLVPLFGAQTPRIKKLTDRKQPESLRILAPLSRETVPAKSYARLASRSLYLIQMIREEEHLRETDRQNMIEGISRVTEDYAERIEAIELLQKEAASIDEQALYSRLEDLDVQDLASDFQEETEKERKVIRNKLERKREDLRKIEQLNSRVIRIVSSLDALSLDLISLSTIKAEPVLKSLQQMEEDLRLEKEAMQEVFS